MKRKLPIYLSYASVNHLLHLIEEELITKPSERNVAMYSDKELEDLKTALTTRNAANYILLTPKQLNWVMVEADYLMGMATR